MRAHVVDIPTELATSLKKAVKHGYVLLTRGGKPIAYILPTELYDEEDIGYMTDPEFWKMIAERRQETEGIPLEVVEAELERAEAAKLKESKMRGGKRKAS